MTKNELNGKLATLVDWASQDWRRAVSLGEDLERIYLEFDKARQPVADAAWFLFGVKKMSQGWLLSAGRTQVRDCAKRNGEAAFKMGLPVSGSDCNKALEDIKEQVRVIAASGFAGLMEGIAKKYIEVVTGLFDREREKVSDAAWLLFNGGRAMQEDLRHTSAERILFNYGLLAVTDVRNAMYPDRERNADAAQFLWRSNTNPVDDRKSSLINCPPSTIRLAARYRQEALAWVVADNAWIAFDEGGFGADLKCAPPKRIHDLAVMAKAKQAAREPVGIMDIEGHGANGERITVRGAVVLRVDSGSLVALSERLGKQYGIDRVSSVSMGSLS